MALVAATLYYEPNVCRGTARAPGHIALVRREKQALSETTSVVSSRQECRAGSRSNKRHPPVPVCKGSGITIMTSGSSWYFTMAIGFCWLSMIACITLGFWNAAANSGSAMILLITCAARRPR